MNTFLHPPFVNFFLAPYVEQVDQRYLQGKKKKSRTCSADTNRMAGRGSSEYTGVTETGSIPFILAIKRDGGRVHGGPRGSGV